MEPLICSQHATRKSRWFDFDMCVRVCVCVCVCICLFGQRDTRKKGWVANPLTQIYHWQQWKHSSTQKGPGWHCWIITGIRKYTRTHETAHTNLSSWQICNRKTVRVMYHIMRVSIVLCKHIHICKCINNINFTSSIMWVCVLHCPQRAEAPKPIAFCGRRGKIEGDAIRRLPNNCSSLWCLSGEES